MPVLTEQRCRHCGGTLAVWDDEIGVQRCILCCHPHDSEGNLIPTRDPILEEINLHVFAKRWQPKANRR